MQEDPAGDTSTLVPDVSVPPVVPGSPPEDAADLRRVTVISDGGTALVVTFATTGDPVGSLPIAFALDVALGECRSSFAAHPQDAPSGGGVVRWYQDGSGCPMAAELPLLTGSVQSDPRWTVRTGATSVELRIPLDTLTPAQAAVPRPGAVLSAPAASSYRYATAGAGEEVRVQFDDGHLDDTATGRHWVLGEDAS